MERRRSAEAASCALATMVWSQKLQYHVSKRPPLVPILSQVTLDHTAPSFLSKTPFNIIHPPTENYNKATVKLRIKAIPVTGRGGL
jgi:hypothetical protein